MVTDTVLLLIIWIVVVFSIKKEEVCLPIYLLFIIVVRLFGVLMSITS